MQIGGFIGALVFSLVFFGVYNVQLGVFATGQQRALHALIAIVFLILAWALGIVIR